MFIKRVVKETLSLKFVEALGFEMDLHSIGVIEDTDDIKDSKETGKKTQASFTKDKEKYSFYMEILSNYLNILMNELL